LHTLQCRQLQQFDRLLQPRCEGELLLQAQSHDDIGHSKILEQAIAGNYSNSHAKLTANDMTSIRDPDSGSPPYEALALHRDELEAVLAVARLGYCRIDISTRFVAANSQFKAEFGWAPDAQIDSAGLLERVDREDRSKLADALHAPFTEGAGLDLVVRAVWPDGTLQWVALRGCVANDGSDRISVILTSRNVTAQMQTAALQEAERAANIACERQLRTQAEAANRGKDRFLSVFSHELRSPLSAILGWNRILMLKRADDAEVMSITARIEHSARAQLKMVNDLLDLGRIESGKLKVEPRPMQLTKVLAAAIDSARPTAAAKGVSIVQDFEPGAGQVRGDPDRLQQVVANLLSNAMKFTSAGGQISVDLRNVEGFTQVTVADTGQGIAAELLPHVFDRFRQGDDSSTRQSGGLGLGLALVREVVTLHGGCVRVSSPGPGQGATFVVRLPVRPAWKSDGPRPTDGQASGPHPSLGGLSILVVDDEPDARSVVAETLKLEGAYVTVTDSAVSAFAKVQEPGMHFDVLVTDIGMPDEDGYSLVRKLRALRPCQQLLAVAVTGYVSKTDVDAAMDAGFDLHVPKPLDFDTFVPLVHQALDGKSVRR
jgi:signal transduction histidine kinase/ActR/RegA family two-component response regulator